MRRWSSWHGDDRGSASLEFVGAGLLLLVPMVYLVLCVASLQAGSFAVEGAARHAARVFVQGRTLAEATAQAQQAVRFAISDYGLNPRAVDIRVDCYPTPSDCLRRRGRVTITVWAAVTLPLAPPALAVDSPMTISMQASSTEQVSVFHAPL